MRAKSLSRVRPCATPWTVACQAPLSMGFPRQEYWSGCHALALGDIPDPGIKPESLLSPVLAGRFCILSAQVSKVTDLRLYFQINMSGTTLRLKIPFKNCCESENKWRIIQISFLAFSLKLISVQGYFQMKHKPYPLKPLLRSYRGNLTTYL